MTIEEHDMETLVNNSYEEFKLIFKDIPVTNEEDYLKWRRLFGRSLQLILGEQMRSLLSSYMWGHQYMEINTYNKINEIVRDFLTKNSDDIDKFEQELKKSLRQKFCSLE